MKNKLINFIIKGIQEKKGEEIVTINLSNINNTICDNFIICHGTSGRQVNSIAESITKTVKENLKINAINKEGIDNAQWVLLDYQNIIVHIFEKDTRDFYNIEGLWADA